MKAPRNGGTERKTARLCGEAAIGYAIPLLGLIGGDEVLAASGPAPGRAVAAALLAGAIGLCSFDRATNVLGSIERKVPGATLDTFVRGVAVASAAAVPLSALA